MFEDSLDVSVNVLNSVVHFTLWSFLVCPPETPNIYKHTETHETEPVVVYE